MPPSDPWDGFNAAKQEADALASSERLLSGNISTLVVLAVQTVALRHPQELRRALSDVFSPLELEAQYERLETMLGVWGIQVGEVLDKLRAAQDRIAALERRLERLETLPLNRSIK